MCKPRDKEILRTGLPVDVHEITRASLDEIGIENVVAAMQDPVPGSNPGAELAHHWVHAVADAVRAASQGGVRRRVVVLERLAAIHPVAGPSDVMQQLCDSAQGIDDGEGCPAAERRLAADRVTVLVLHRFGHRFPAELESGAPAPADVDEDGVIPLTSGPNERPLIERLRHHLADTGTTEADLGKALDLPLDQWLGVRFAGLHTSQFVKQESAWHPDVNDGVRVNIAPLQRADERRWVSEGKLPRPGWCPEEVT